MAPGACILTVQMTSLLSVDTILYQNLMSQNKWAQAAKRDMYIGDVVVVADAKAIRAKLYN